MTKRKAGFDQNTRPQQSPVRAQVQDALEDLRCQVPHICAGGDTIPVVAKALAYAR